MPLPSGYKELSYLESTGTQYIIPEIYLGNPTFVNTEAIIDSNKAGTQGLFGAYTDIRPDQFFCGLYGGRLRIYSGQTMLSILDDEQYHNYYSEPNKVWIDSQSTVGTTFAGTSGDLHLFRGYMGNGSQVYPAFAKVRFFRIYNAQMALTAYLVPALRKADDKPGMYDIVRNKFYTNVGSGEFLYEIEDTSSIRVKVNGSWKTGTPYIKVNGQWKKGTAYIKTNGSWKKGV